MHNLEINSPNCSHYELPWQDVFFSNRQQYRFWTDFDYECKCSSCKIGKLIGPNDSAVAWRQPMAFNWFAVSLMRATASVHVTIMISEISEFGQSHYHKKKLLGIL